MCNMKFDGNWVCFLAKILYAITPIHLLDLVWCLFFQIGEKCVGLDWKSNDYVYG